MLLKRIKNPNNTITKTNKNMEREETLNKLTLLDTQSYRLKSMREFGVYKKEPKGFRVRLHEIYNELSTEELEVLLKLKKL